MQSTEIGKRLLTLDELAHEEGGTEFWYAREIQEMLGYTEWRNFELAVKRAMVSADTAERPARNHFVEVNKMVSLGSGSQRKVRDYKLTRYACYLIAMNGDTRKPEIAFAQSYFAMATRKQELIEKRMGELQRLTARKSLAESEKALAAAAFERVVGVIRRIGGHVCDFRDNGDGTYSYGQDVVGPSVHAALQQSPEVAECARKVVCGSFGGTIKAKNVTFNVMGGGTTTISADEAQTFSTFATEAKIKVPTDRSVSSVSHGMYLCPDSGSYHGGRSGYSFTTPGDSGAVYRHVTIEDEEFLAKVASGDVRLGGGDMLRVDLRTEQSVGRNNRLTTSYAIERVLEYVKLPTQEQRTLFDSEA